MTIKLKIIASTKDSTGQAQQTRRKRNVPAKLLKCMSSPCFFLGGSIINEHKSSYAVSAQFGKWGPRCKCASRDNAFQSLGTATGTHLSPRVTLVLIVGVTSTIPPEDLGLYWPWYLKDTSL